MSETWKLHHLGIPVPDLDRAIEDYQTLGNATFQPEFLIDSARMQEYLVYGKTPDPTVKTRGAWSRVSRRSAVRSTDAEPTRSPQVRGQGENPGAGPSSAG